MNGYINYFDNNNNNNINNTNNNNNNKYMNLLVHDKKLLKKYNQIW